MQYGPAFNTTGVAVTSADGTTSSVTVNITGTNDAALIPPVTVALTETDAPLSTSGTLSITDPRVARLDDRPLYTGPSRSWTLKVLTVFFVG